jgi:hypothetical protein
MMTALDRGEPPGRAAPWPTGCHGIRATTSARPSLGSVPVRRVERSMALREAIIGATGNVGSRVLERLQADTQVTSIVAIARRRPERHRWTTEGQVDRSRHRYRRSTSASRRSGRCRPPGLALSAHPSPDGHMEVQRSRQRPGVRSGRRRPRRHRCVRVICGRLFAGVRPFGYGVVADPQHADCGLRARESLCRAVARCLRGPESRRARGAHAARLYLSTSGRDAATAALRRAVAPPLASAASRQCTPRTPPRRTTCTHQRRPRPVQPGRRARHHGGYPRRSAWHAAARGSETRDASRRSADLASPPRAS